MRVLFWFCCRVLTERLFPPLPLRRRVQHECHHHHQPPRAEVNCVRSSCLPFDIDYGAFPLGCAPLVAPGEEEENYALLSTKTMLEIVRSIFSVEEGFSYMEYVVRFALR